MTRTFYVPEDRRPPGRGSCDDTRRSTWHHIRWAGVGTGPGPRPRPHSSRVSGPGRSRTGTCQVGRPLAAAPGAPSPGDRSRNRFRRSDASYLPSFHFSTIFTASSSIDERSTPRTTSLLAAAPRAGPSSLFTAPHRLHHPPRLGSPELTRAQRGPGWMMDRVRQGRTVSPSSGQLSRALLLSPSVVEDWQSFRSVCVSFFLDRKFVWTRKWILSSLFFLFWTKIQLGSDEYVWQPRVKVEVRYFGG